MKRTAKAHWQGDLKSGHGHLTTQSGVLLETQYSFNTRFADGIGSNPEQQASLAKENCVISKALAGVEINLQVDYQQ